MTGYSELTGGAHSSLLIGDEYSKQTFERLESFNSQSIKLAGKALLEGILEDLTFGIGSGARKQSHRRPKL